MLPRRCVPALAALAAAALGACGDDPAPAVDAAIDTPSGSCGADVPFTGEIVDWDATTVKFCGVFDARVTVRGSGSATQTDATAPNGRFELCVPRQALTVLDVAFSTSPSECTTPKAIYPVPAVLVAPQALVDSGVLSSARAMIGDRQTTMFAQVGAAYSAAQAQLVVHVTGTPRRVSISSAHASVQVFDGTAWNAGDTGSDVFFPNVAPGPTQVTVDGVAGTTALTVESGAYTYLTVRAN